MSFPNNIPLLPPDPIMGLPQLFHADPRPHKVNLGIGVYKTSEGASLLLNCVRAAEHQMVQKCSSKDYQPIEGDPEYLKCCASLIFGENSSLIMDENLWITQTLGGSGALRLCGEFLAKQISKSIFISQPAWSNYQIMFERAGLNVGSYPYLNSQYTGIDFSSLCAAIKMVPAQSTIVMQVCGHNPSGFDPTFEQWKELSSIFKQKQLFPLFDIAYHGLVEDPVKDIQAIRYFVQQGHDMMVSYSFSKNMGLYGERVGCLAIVSQQPGRIPNIASQLKFLIRSHYSNPPICGARIVTTVLKSPELTADWHAEVKNMQGRVVEMRNALIAQLFIKKPNDSFMHMHEQKGLFALCGLTEEQVERLRSERAVYMPSNGRINLAGVTTRNVEYVAESIVSVM